jgi:hypothetical protein
LSTLGEARTRRGRVGRGLAVSVLVLSLAGCAAEAPPRGLEATCAKSCEARAPGCSPHECARGCNLVLDRLAENEGGHVLACVARVQAQKNACGDREWARCATRIGPHADGGPPAPPAAPDVEDVTEGD